MVYMCTLYVGTWYIYLTNHFAVCGRDEEERKGEEGGRARRRREGGVITILTSWCYLKVVLPSWPS